MNNNPTTEERLRDVLKLVFGASTELPADLTQLCIVRDLKADSLDMVDLVMAAEEEFNIELSDAEVEPFVSDDGTTNPQLAGALIALIDGKLGERVR